MHINGIGVVILAAVCLSQVTSITVTPSHGFVKPSNSCAIECKVNGDLATGKYSVQWHRNGKLVQNEKDKYIIHDANKTLEILDVDFDQDLGLYVCQLNLENNQTINSTVNVYGLAYVTHFEKSKNIVEDDALNLTCKASGYPLPTVSWSVNGNPINYTSERISYTNYNDVVNASIKILKMQFKDAGEYSCEAINTMEGSTYNATEKITVRVKDKLAALWPFLGICCEVTILCIIIFFYERHRNKKLAEEDAKEEASHLTNSHANREDPVRQRKV